MSEEMSTVLDATGVDAGADVGQDDGALDEGADTGEQTEGEGPEQNDGEEPEESAEAGEEGEGEQVEGATASADGRKMPDGLKKAIAGLKATNPEVAKQIKGLFYADQEYRNAFPTPADAVTAKTTLEEIGGLEGIQEISAEREEWSQIDRDFSEGKKEFVTSLADGNPDAFLKTAPHVINEFAQRAPEQYEYYANNVALNKMSSTGLSLENLAAAHARYADNPQAQAIIAEVHNALAGLKEKSTQFEQKRSSVDPERQKLQQDKSQFETQRRADFEDRIANEAQAYLTSKMQAAIDVVVNGRKIDPEAMKGYQGMVEAEINKRLEQIPGIAEKLEAHYRTGDSKKSLDYIQAQYNRLLPIAAKVIEPFLRNIAPSKSKPATPAPGASDKSSSGEIILKEMPSWDQIDFNKCSPADVMQGNCVLKSGKRASGWI